MDFSWTEEQRARYDETVRFAQDQLSNETLVDRDREGVFPHDLWKRCAEHGVLGWNVPEAYGGQGLDVLTSVYLMEALGYGCADNGLPFSLNSQVWSAQQAILKFGSEEQKGRYLPPLCRGETYAAFAITEAGVAGSDSYAMETRAEKVEGGYVLNGSKSYITLAPICDVAVVFATLDPDKGRWGISAFLVDRGTDGFETSPVRDKMGMRTTPMGDLHFEDCFVPDSQRLGPEGSGVSLFTTAMESERGYIFASQVGRLKRQLEEAVEHVRGRKAFGKSIGKFQSVSNRIADMRLRLETGRLLLYKVAWMDLHDQPVLLEAALAKLHLSECFVDSSLDFIRLHGAEGYVTEFGIERDLRDGVGGLIYSGTSDIQRQIVARLLGL